MKKYSLLLSILVMTSLLGPSLMAQTQPPPVPKMPQGPFPDEHSEKSRWEKMKKVKPTKFDPGEVGPAVTTSKTKSKNASSTPGWKPPSWWVEGFAAVKGIINFFSGKNERSGPEAPGYNSYSKTPILDYDYKPGMDSIGKNDKKYYMTYLVGFGIGMRGSKFVSPNTSETDRLLYLQIPIVKARFNYILPGSSTVYVEGGAYYGIALTGHYKDNTGTHPLKLGNSDADDYRRGDWGLKFGIGYRFAYLPILIGIDNDLGLRNITPGGSSEFKTTNLAFDLKVLYRLGF